MKPILPAILMAWAVMAHTLTAQRNNTSPAPATRTTAVTGSPSPAVTPAPPPAATPKRGVADLEKLFEPIALHHDPLVAVIMTVIVNQQGQVYQKDLGKKTSKIATEMKRYDPDGSWRLSSD
jgi:hypothetical protein